MKVLKITCLLAAGLGVGFAGLMGQEPAVPAPQPVTQELTEAELLETYGFLVASQVGIREMDLDEEGIKAFLEGFGHGVQSAEPPRDIESAIPQLQAYLEEKQAVASARAAEASRAEASEFFAELQERDDVESTESGLYYEIVERGDGDLPGPNDTVRIHYRGSLLSGETFDSSYQRGEPAEFPLTGIIGGMSEGLQLLPAGSEAILYIPSDLGYGDQGAGNIPPGATLIFEVELLDIVD